MFLDTLKRISGPTQEFISVSEAKVHLKVDHELEDDLIKRLITAARRHTENRIGRVIGTQVWQLKLASWPGESYLPFPIPPLIGVDLITYKDRDGNLMTLHEPAASPEVISTLFDVEIGCEPGLIVLKPSEAWPSDLLYEGLPITIQFRAGLDPSGQEQKDLIQAMLLLLAHWFEHRESVIVGTIAQMNAIATGTLPLAFDALLEGYVWFGKTG